MRKLFGFGRQKKQTVTENTIDIEDLFLSQAVLQFDEATPHKGLSLSEAVLQFKKTAPHKGRHQDWKVQKSTTWASVGLQTAGKGGAASSLPVDVLLQVFSFVGARSVLSTIQLVCKFYFTTAMQDQLWRQFLITEAPSITTFVPDSNVHINKAVDPHLEKIAKNFVGRHMSLIFKRFFLLYTIPTPTEKFVWDFRCPLSWLDLKPTDNNKERICTSCGTHVKWYTPDEIAEDLPFCGLVATENDVGKADFNLEPLIMMGKMMPLDWNNLPN
eukprot:TRINITY_DN53569_c0_g1_i1.p1 TRINITY_DN53569_c0_g1~~TRINITY_DN53569_c0_g1_i1.p1  ORF type:complete len:272 (-),score=25.83 TRINITY_DN53569_c0_g1_i1:648-1463(-)